MARQIGYPRGNGPTLPSAAYGLDAIPTAWQVIRMDLAMWMVSTIVVLLLHSFVSFGLQTLARVIGFGSPFASRPQDLFASGDSPVLIAFRLLIYFGVVTVSGFVANGLTVGYQYMAVRRLRGYSLDLADMFVVFKNIFPILSATILVSILSGIGMLLCIVPGIYLSVALVFAPLLAADRGTDGIEAMKMSFAATKGHILVLFGTILLAFFCNLLGLMACCIGLLASYPIYTVVIALHYNYFFGRLPAPGQVAAVPSAE